MRERESEAFKSRRKCVCWKQHILFFMPVLYAAASFILIWKNSLRESCESEGKWEKRNFHFFMGIYP